MNYYHVDPDKITILSQYKAQCTEIEHNLKGLGYEHPNVGTVIASQGQCLYFYFYLQLDLKSWHSARVCDNGYSIGS